MTGSEILRNEELVVVCCPDISGHLRGKAFPLADLQARLQRGIGWCPTNVQITTFDFIADTPFGALGDLLMIPDPATQVRVDFGDGSASEHFMLGNVHETDGAVWDCCLRSHLLEALSRLQAEAGLSVKCAFELEFQFLDDTPNYGPGFSLIGLRAKKAFAEQFLGALRQAGVEPDSFLKEWGAAQYEVTMHPRIGVTAADHAVITRELARATAERRGEAITFTPIRDPDGAGNGVHVHISLLDDEGRPVTYDSAGPGGLSRPAGQFVAGILHHLPAIVALTAPSVISYDRLTPHRWSAVFNNLGYRDRESAVRICPIVELPGMDPAPQYNFEFRAGDSAASPHLQLAALVFAGLDGIRQGMEPPPPSEEDLSLLSAEELQRRGYVHLPQSLPEALDRLAASDAVRSWFGDRFIEVYVKHKRGEMQFLEGKTREEIFQAYEKAY